MYVLMCVHETPLWLHLLCHALQVCSRIFGNATGLVDMLVEHVPSSRVATAGKVSRLYTGPREDSQLVQFMNACSRTGASATGPITHLFLCPLSLCLWAPRPGSAYYPHPQPPVAMHQPFWQPASQPTGQPINMPPPRNAIPSGPLVMHIAKLFPKNDASSFDAFGRILSGTLRPGDEVRVLGEAYTPDDDEDSGDAVVSQVWLYQARYR
jgi:hypothetical protein